MDAPLDAIDTLVAFARMVSDSRLSPDEIAPTLVDAAVEHGGVAGALVVLLEHEGRAVVRHVRGVDSGLVGQTVDLITTELGEDLLDRCGGGFRFADTQLLVSHGGLYGALVLFGNQPPEPLQRRLVASFADLSAVALDNAFQHAELRRAMEELTQSRQALARQERLEVLGRMAAVVAHEIKNPLAAISGTLQVLRTRFPEESRDRRIVGVALDRLTDLANQMTDLLTFARPRPPQMRRVPVQGFLQGLVTVFEQDPAHAGVDIRVSGWSGAVAIDPDQMSGVLLNLLLNACQAMEGQGSVALVVHGPEDGFCRLTVTDSGPGIPEEAREQIWEAFFTTKTRGTGLGLATARRIVEEHGGTLTVSCPPEGGSVFTLRVPC